MLRNTFLHIPGIGPKTERRIWEAGINTWDDFLCERSRIALAGSLKERALQWIDESAAAFDAGNAAFFARTLPSREMWRCYSTFQNDAAFLDIETTGMSAELSPITCIGLYDGGEPKLYVLGLNLEAFADEVSRYKLLITYNGASFDLPFIRARLPDAPLPPLHIDLRYVLRRLGYAGGLKSIERQMGIERDERIRGLDGYDAVRLWHAYEHGDTDALRLMLEYNLADIVNLQELMEVAYNALVSRMECYTPLVPLSARKLSRQDIVACLKSIGI